MVNLGDNYLIKKRGWSKRKVEILRLILVIGLYIFFIYIAFSVIWIDQQCMFILPTGELWSLNLTDPKLPTLHEFLAKTNLTNGSNCTYVTHCYERLECNYSFNEDPCWAGIC